MFLFDFFKKKDFKRVLSLDGGGVRALAAVIFLKQLEKETGRSVFDTFDFFMGVSAGGLNALHFTINKTSAEKLEDFWTNDNLAMSMQKSFWGQAVFLNSKPKYNNESRTALLRDYFENKLIAHSDKPVSVLAYDVEKRKPRLISSYDDSNISVISAINATSAAPLYYPTVKIEDGSWLIDGGVVANNPSLIGYNEARNYFKTSNIKVFSIGTGINSKGLDGKSSAEWGPIGWLRNDILGILSETQYDHETLSDLLKEDYLRINSSMKEINFSMDDYSFENLEKIKKMGMLWWSEFGDRAIKFLDSN